MKRHLLLIIMVLFVSQLSGVFADDWPEFRGYSRSGYSAETGLLDSWPEGGPELLWSVEGVLGLGWSSVSVVDDITYIAGTDKKSKEGAVFAFDKSGKQLWRTVYGLEWAKSFPGTRNTPTFSNDRIYMNSGLAKVTCLDAHDGKVIWAVDTQEKYKGKAGRWGFSDSALIYDDLVITTPGGDLGAVVALNAESGKEMWVTTDLTEASIHCSPILVSHNGLDMIVAVLSESIVAIEAGTGKVLWKVPYSEFEPQGRRIGARANCPIYSDGKIFLSSGYEKGAVMLELSEDGRSASVAGTLADFDTHTGGDVKVGDYVYGTNSAKPNKWVCMNWNDCKYSYEYDWDNNKGTLIAAEGYLYCYGEQNGIVALVKADPAGFNIVSQFKVDWGSGEHWAHLAISNGRLYVHRGDSLRVYNISK